MVQAFTLLRSVEDLIQRPGSQSISQSILCISLGFSIFAVNNLGVIIAFSQTLGLFHDAESSFRFCYRLAISGFLGSTPIVMFSHFTSLFLLPE